MKMGAGSQAEENEMLAYLLGTLPEEKRPGFEQRYFSDPAFFEQLEAFEDELLRDYALQQLSADVRMSLEHRLQADPILKRKAAEAAALARSFQQIGSSAERKTQFHWLPLRRWAAPILCVAATLLVIVLWVGTRQEHQYGPRLSAHRDTRTPSTTISPTGAKPEQSARSSPAAVVALVLNPGIFRGGPQKEIYLPSQAGNLQLTLRSTALLAGNDYGIVIRTDSGKPVWSASGRPEGRGGSVTATAPVAALAAGSYVVTVSGKNPADTLDYSFVVRR
jgi:hypothetical protein